MHTTPGTEFVGRRRELAALAAAYAARSAQLLPVYGRRRVGKTRLLVDWARREGGVYWTADEYTAALQRKYFAEANGSVYEVAAAVDVAGVLGVMREADVKRATALALRVTQMLSRMMR